MIPKIYQQIAKIFIAISLVIIIIIVFFEAGKATVTISAKTQEREINFTTPVTNTGDNETLKGRILISDPIEKVRKFPTVKVSIPQTKAGGTVIIYNKNNKNQQLVATTRVQSPDGLIFRLIKAVNVPAGGQVEVTVLADQTGNNYAIGPSSFIIPGLNLTLQKLIYAESKVAMSFESEPKYQLDQATYDQAKADLIADIKKDALANFEKTLTENETLKNDALVADIIEEKSTAKIGDEVKDFDLSVKATVKTLAFSESDLREKIIKQLQESLAAGDQVVYDNTQMTLNIELAELAVGADTTSIATIYGQYKVKILNSNIDLSKITGQKKADAENYLNSLSNIEDVQINLWPFWVKTVPKNQDKIEVKIK